MTHSFPKSSTSEINGQRIKKGATREAETFGHTVHPHVTALLARRAGFELVPTPTFAASGRDLLILFAKQSRKTSDMAETIIAAHDDDILTVGEAEAIEAEADRVIANALAIRADARMIQDRKSTRMNSRHNSA